MYSTVKKYVVLARESYTRANSCKLLVYYLTVWPRTHQMKGRRITENALSHTARTLLSGTRIQLRTWMSALVVLCPVQVEAEECC